MRQRGPIGGAAAGETGTGTGTPPPRMLGLSSTFALAVGSTTKVVRSHDELEDFRLRDGFVRPQLGMG